MKNWSLNAKVAFVFSILCVSAVGIAVLGLSKMGNINALMEEVSGPLVQRDQLTSQIQDLQRQQIIINKEIIIEKRLDKMLEMEKRLDGVRADMFKAVDDYEAAAGETGKKMAAEYREKFAVLADVNRRIRELTKAGKDEQVYAILDKEEPEARVNARAVLKKMNEWTAEQLKNATEEARSSYSQARAQMFLISVVAILVASALGFIIMRAVSKSINHVIESLDENSAQVTSAAQQIAAASEELSQAGTEQASSLEETAASVEEMNSMIGKNSENARNVADVASKSQDSAVRGKDVVEKMMNSMTEINASNVRIQEQVNRSNEEISGIVKVINEIGAKTKVINDIVFQTKLLSFNASVEAARAGEHGKGFAVVAEEVGNLAQMSGNAAKEISSLLEGSIQQVETIVSQTKTGVEHLIHEGKQKVEAGAEVARQCADVLNEIVNNVSTAAHMAGEISTASQEQSRGIHEITKAMSQLDQVTQQNAAVSEEAASSAEQLSVQAEALKGVVDVLVQTIRGGTREHQPVREAAKAAPRAEVRRDAKVVALKPKASEPAKSAPAKKTADGSVPAYNDSRFEDV